MTTVEQISIVGLIIAFLATWGMILWRASNKTLNLPSVSSWSVPWNGTDVLVILAGFAFFSIAEGAVAHKLIAQAENSQVLPAVDSLSPAADKKSTGKELDLEHPIVQLAERDSSVWSLLLIACSAVIIAPLVEEFLFRGVIQGWLESVITEYQQDHPRAKSRGRMFAVLISATWFAAMHIRPPGTFQHLEILIPVNVASKTLFLLLVCGYLNWSTGRPILTTIFGSPPYKRDVLTAICCFFATQIVLLAIFFGAGLIAKEMVELNLLDQLVVVDPLPLFLLALGLGYLYSRSGRLLTCVVWHALFNLFSFIQLLARIHAQ